MSESKSGFVLPGVSPFAGGIEQRAGEGARQAAIGSGERAKEAQQKAIGKARRKAEEAIAEYNRGGQLPEKLSQVRKAIEKFRRLIGIS